jgi:hypothetical protein
MLCPKWLGWFVSRKVGFSHLKYYYSVFGIAGMGSGQNVRFMCQGFITLAFWMCVWGVRFTVRCVLCNFQCRKLIPLLETVKRTPKTHIQKARSKRKLNRPLNGALMRMHAGTVRGTGSRGIICLGGWKDRDLREIFGEMVGVPIFRPGREKKWWKNN